MNDVKPNGAQPEKGLGRLRTGLGRHQTSNSRARTERLLAFFHHAHSSSVLLKVMLEQLRRSCL